MLNKRVKIFLHCTVSDAAVERLNVPTMFPVLSFDRLFGIIRHYENNVNLFYQKSTNSIICTLAGFVAQICHLFIMQPMFWPVISATSIHFCLLIVSLGPESHRKWPRTVFILVIYVSMLFIHQSLQILCKLVTTRQCMESYALVKFSRWKWPGQWV